MSFGDRQRFDGAVQLYRARFSVFPYETTESALIEVVRKLQRWVIEKERRKRHGDGSIVHALSVGHDDSGVARGFIAGGLSVPEYYCGGMSTLRGSRLAVDALMGADGEPTCWALEYDEDDASVRGRRWNTCVGIKRQNEATDCVVNIRLSYYYLPSYIVESDNRPARSVPMFVKWLIEDGRYSVCAGETVVRSSPLILSAGTFGDFRDDLLSGQRELPLVLQVANKYRGRGTYLVDDVDVLAAKLRGVANVYLADLRDNVVSDFYYDLFPKETPSERYRCPKGGLRVYLPHIDLSDSKDSISHRFFTADTVAKRWGSNYEFVESLVAMFSGSQATHVDDVVDLDDVERERRRIKYRSVRDRMDDLARSAEASAGEYHELLDLADTECRELERQLCDAGRRAADAERRCQDAEARCASLRDEILWSERERIRLDEDARRARGAAEAVRLRADALDSLSCMPRNLFEVLEFVGRAYPSKMVVLDEARRSARDYTFGNLLEQWGLLMTIPVVP